MNDLGTAGGNVVFMIPIDYDLFYSEILNFMSTTTDFKSAFTDSIFRTNMHSSGEFMPVHVSAFITRKC